MLYVLSILYCGHLTHFGHENIIKYTNRPFKSFIEMDKALIKNHNSLVNEEDTTYIVGDFSLRGSQHTHYYKYILDRMNGKKVLILGNHDSLKPFSYINVGFYSVHTHLELNIGGVDCVLVHDPVHSITAKEKTFICGHVHDMFKIHKNVINVGVDVWDFKPASEEEIIKITKEV